MAVAMGLVSAGTYTLTRNLKGAAKAGAMAMATPLVPVVATFLTELGL